MANKEQKHPFSKARGAVALLCVLAVIAGLLFPLGTGTPSALGALDISTICPLGALEAMFGTKQILVRPLILLAITAAIVLIVGKAFCGWICPVPWIERLFRRRKKKAGSHPDENGERQKDGSAAQSPCTACWQSPCSLAEVGGTRGKLQIDSRHVVLLGALGSAAAFGFPVFCLICPIGLTFAVLIGLWSALFCNTPSIALVISSAILLLEVVFFRKWCSKICPLGALMSLISTGNRTFKPRVSKDNCLRQQGVDCRTCVEVCPEKLDPHTSFIPECTKCGLCAESCPAHAISMRLLPKKEDRIEDADPK